MTREEAIKYGIEWLKDEYLDAKDGAFIKIALEALEQEPCKDAVSRQEILDYLDKMPSELTSDGRRMVRRRTLEEYISDTLPPVTPQPKTGHWIPVSERLPEKNVEVLVTTEWDCITIGEMFSSNDWFIHEGATNADIDDIKAWMPLPIPYDSQESEEEE